MPDLPPLGREDLDAARERAKRRGRQLRARRRLGASAAVVAALTLTVGLVASGQEDVEDIHTVGPDSTASTTSTTGSTIAAAPIEPVAPSPTVSSTTTTSRSPTSTTTTSRRRSQPTAGSEPPPERRCVTATGEGGGVMPGWEEYWATQPQPNDPLTLEMCIDDVTPAVGQLVTATLTATDPDAALSDQACGAIVLWEEEWVSLCGDVVPSPPASAPTPPEEPGRLTKSLTHRYEARGSRTVTGQSRSGQAWSPYASFARVRITVTVH